MAKSRYDSQIHPAAAQTLCRDGFTDEELAKRFGISPSTLYKWRQEHPELAAAMAQGKDKADDEVEAALFKRAIGFEYEEIEIVNARTKTKTTEPDGSIVETERIRPSRTIKRKKRQAGDVVAQIFWLKNRRRAKWGDRAGELDAQDLSKIDVLLKKLEGEADAELLQRKAG